MAEEYKPEDFPIAIRLRFRNQKDKDFFMAGLSDGWGEDAAALTWDTSLDKNWDGQKHTPNYSFYLADTFLVEPFRDEPEEEEEVRDDQQR